METVDRTLRVHPWLVGLVAAGVSLCALEAQQPAPSPAPHQRLVAQYCASCHNETLKTAGLALDLASARPVSENAPIWEKAVRKLRGRQMPPVGSRRPDEATYEAVISSLQASLDSAAATRPNPGRTDTFRRLTRTEYRNSHP